MGAVTVVRHRYSAWGRFLNCRAPGRRLQLKIDKKRTGLVWGRSNNVGGKKYFASLCSSIIDRLPPESKLFFSPPVVDGVRTRRAVQIMDDQKQFYSTREVARMLDIKPGTLSKALWCGSVPAPNKGPSGTFLWAPADIDRAAHYFQKAVRL